MAGRKGSPSGRCQGCNHPERVRVERFLAAGASIKGAARKFAIDYHALRRHWRNHVSAEARATYVAGTGASKDQLEEIVADESVGLIDHYRIVRGTLYKGFSAAAELGDSNALALLAGRLHENFRDCGRLTGELQRGPLLNIQNNVLVKSRLHAGDCPARQCGGALSGGARSVRDLDAESSAQLALTDRRDERAENG
jgi:hypothetical protein